jgi:hypothetical protein
MEACGSAHYWGRQFRQLGHKVLVPLEIRGYLPLLDF